MLVIDTALDQCNGVKVAADWIRDLESSDSRLYKEGVIEKALVASRIGSTSAQCFLYNCYLALALIAPRRRAAVSRAAVFASWMRTSARHHQPRDCANGA